jgi:hypothetical protein
MNLQTDYVEEHAANAGTIDILEVETSERMRLERELSELRVIIFSSISVLPFSFPHLLLIETFSNSKFFFHSFTHSFSNQTKSFVAGK